MSVEHFQQLHRESKHEPPFLWGSAATNCAPLAPDQAVRCKMPEDLNLPQQIPYPYKYNYQLLPLSRYPSLVYIYIYIYIYKGKVIPLQARCGPEGG